MGFLQKIRRNAIIATGDFEQIFGEFTLPPCPEVVLRLTEAVQDPDVFIDHVVQILETDPALTSLILKTVNSAIYGLPGKVSSVSKAVSMIGLKEIENIALGFALKSAIKDPGLEHFDFSIFWTDSLYRALFAKYAAKALDVEAEEAFAAGLLQDMAIPVLLTEWFDVYKPVYDKWSSSEQSIHEVETQRLSWNHCQAAAWIAGQWGLPDLMVCCTGLHSASLDEIRELELHQTAVTPVALSSVATQAFRSSEKARMLVLNCSEAGIKKDQLFSILGDVEEQLENMAVTLDINPVERQSLVEIIEDAQEE